MPFVNQSTLICEHFPYKSVSILYPMGNKHDRRNISAMTYITFFIIIRVFPRGKYTYHFVENVVKIYVHTAFIYEFHLIRAGLSLLFEI